MQSVNFFRSTFFLIPMRSCGSWEKITIPAVEQRVLITSLGLCSHQVVEPGVKPKFSDCGKKEADNPCVLCYLFPLSLFKKEPKHFAQTQTKFPSFQKSWCVGKDSVLWWESRFSLQGSASLPGFSIKLQYSLAILFRHASSCFWVTISPSAWDSTS